MDVELCTTVQRFLMKRMDGTEQCCGASKGGPRWRRMEYDRVRDWNSHMPEIQERALVGWLLVGHMTEVAM